MPERGVVLTALLVAGVIAVGAIILFSGGDNTGNAAAAEPVLEEIDDEQLESTAETPTEDVKGKAEPAEPAKDQTTEGPAEEAETSPDDRQAQENKCNEHARKGKKYFSGQKFAKAAEEFSLAIELAEDLDLPWEGTLETLYNNRSAMYEKLGKYEEALTDTLVIVSLNKTHTKVRKRRARILLAQGKPEEALEELTVVMIDANNRIRAEMKKFEGNEQMMQYAAQQWQANNQDDMQKTLEQIQEILTAAGEAEYEKSLPTQGPNTELPTYNMCQQVMLTYTSFLALEKEYKGVNKSEFDAGVGSSDAVDRTTALLGRGKWYVVNGQFGEAREDFLAAMASLEQCGTGINKQKEADLLQWAGIFQHLMYDFDKALELFDKALQVAPNNADYLVKKSAVLTDKHDIPGAEKLLQEAVSFEPENIDVLMHRAQIWMIKKDNENTLKDLNVVVEKYPGHALAHLRLASVIMTTELAAGDRSKIETIQHHIDQAKKLRPQMSEVYQVQGELQQIINEFEDSIVSLDKAIALDATNSIAYVDKGLAIYQKTMDMPKAVIEFEKAIAADKRCAMAYMRMAELKLSGMCTKFEEVEELAESLREACTYCRDKEEYLELCKVRLQAESQVRAARSLGMESLAPF